MKKVKPGVRIGSAAWGKRVSKTVADQKQSTGLVPGHFLYLGVFDHGLHIHEVLHGHHRQG